MWLTRLALRNPILILMLSLMTVVLGLQSLGRLPVDLFPDITIPVVRVVTFYPGAGPVDIEKSITVPVERAVAAAPGIERVESTSKQGVSIVSAWFSYDTNLDNAQFEVSQRVAQILNTLPPGIQQPFIIKFDVTNIPVLTVSLSSSSLDEKQLYDLAYNVVEPQLERLPGVASASVGGGKQREIEVKVQRDALRARALGILDVVSAVRGANLLLPSGTLRAYSREFNVFANTQLEEARPLRDVIVQPAPPGGQPVRVSDIAEVEDGTADQANIVRVDGVRGVYLRLLKQPKANTIAVVDAVRGALPTLRGVPESTKLQISFDQSSYIRAAVKALEHEALQGGALAIVVILIFLLSLRATGIVAIAIPLSIVATFILLYFTGQSLNVFTLGGLALGVGRLVDDSIVELENIHRHLATEPSRKQAVLAAAQEVAMPILVSTITTIVVFFPVLFLAGVARYLFIPLAMTISFALMMSFFVSRTVTPLLCLYVLRAPSHHGHGAGAAKKRGLLDRIAAALDALDHGYARALGFVLRHRAATVIVILGLCGATVPLYFRIGQEFFPSSDESQFTLSFKAPIGTRVEQTEDLAARLEKTVRDRLGEQPGDGHRAAQKQLYSTMLSDLGLPGGRTAIFTSNTGPHAGNLQVNLLPKAERSVSDTQLTERVRAALRDGFAGIQAYFFTGGIVKRILNFGQPAPIDIEILGYDLEEGAGYAKRLLGKLRGLSDGKGRPLLTDLQITREENYPELRIHVDREKAGVLGLSEQAVAQSVLSTLVGNSQFQPVRFTDPKTGNEYFINVRMDDRYRDDLDDLHDVFLRAPAAGGGASMVALSSVARIERASGPVQINRKYLQRVVDITANIAPTSSLGQSAAAVTQALREAAPPEGFAVKVGGQAEAQREAFSGLGMASLLAVVLVYMVLASQFKSLLSPLVIMCSVPLGVAGVVLMLFLTGTTLSVNSFMGVIMMVGIVVSNGVLLIDFAGVLHRRGRPLVEATIEAGRTRLRPILMTTIATIVGLIPMALGIGEGSETNLPLARAVIGGLLVSTVFTLFLVPALYTSLGRFAAQVSGEGDPSDEPDHRSDQGPGDGHGAAAEVTHA
ncbi:MAG: efflux RND transporter permease subunit [Polyangia bacterium]